MTISLHHSKFVYQMFFAGLLLFSMSMQAQTKRQLEQKRQKLQKEIRQINHLLIKTKTKEKSILSQVTDLDRRLHVRERLVKTINKEVSLMGRDISKNQRQIDSLQNSLQQLKNDYAKMIQKSYKSKSQESRILFLLSSDNFNQAYNRLKYMKQYTTYRKHQGKEIEKQSKLLKKLNSALLYKKSQKDTLLIQTKREQKNIKSEKSRHKKLIAQVKRRESKYLASIRKKQREEHNVNLKIERIIKAAIAKSNKRGGVFKLTPEASALASEFAANKGNLPWPVTKGLVVLGYGLQHHPVVKTATIQSNGIRIATEKGAFVRAVFKGKVLAIQLIPGGQKVVLIQHGNYISVYKNLDTVIVSNGQMVTAKQNIGSVHTDKTTGKSILAFALFKNVKTVNPTLWLKRSH